jgi:uncharacterized tellurite resistance protein B-like protein
MMSGDPFALLVAAAFCDGSAGDQEIALLHRKAEARRISKERVEELLRLAKAGRLRLSSPADAEERRQQLDDLIDVIAADGRIEASERGFLMRYSALLGGVPPDLEERLRARLAPPTPGPGPSPQRNVGPSPLSRPPGPVSLGGPESRPGALPPVTLGLVKQVIHFEGVEVAVRYVMKTCLMAEPEARRAVEEAVASDPGLQADVRGARPSR